MARQCRKGSKGAKEKRRTKNQRQYLSKVQRLRAAEIRDRRGVPGASKMVGPIMNDAMRSPACWAPPMELVLVAQHRHQILGVRVRVIVRHKVWRLITAALAV
jgi:hypothetical protein